MPEPSIRPLGRNWTKLQAMRETLAKQRRVKVSQVYWNEVLTYFFDSIKRKEADIRALKRGIQILEDRVKDLGGKVEAKVSTIEQIAINLSQQAPSPVMMQANPTLISHPQTVNQLAPPPNPPPTPPQLRLQYKPKDTGDVRQDYVNEVKQVFTGEVRKPSEILQLTQPKHKDAEVVEITEVPLLIASTEAGFYDVKNGKKKL